MRLLHRFTVAAAIISMLIPAATSAHFGSEVEGKVNLNVNTSARAEDRHDGDHENRGLFLGHFMKQFTKGTVASVTTNSFVIKTGDDNTATVKVSGTTKLIRLPRTNIAMADIKVGDRVWVQGTRSGDTITATTVYDLSADVKPALRKGEVTAVNGSTITLQTKNGDITTVATDSNTQVKHDGEAAAMADVKVGSDVKIFGLWNKITNLFTAVMIKLK